MLDSGKESTAAKFKVPSSDPTGLNNLYVTDIPKELIDVQVRRTFARYGKISSFSLVSKEQFATNIAFVGFMNPEHARAAFERIQQEEEETLGSKVKLFWHKPKADLKNQLIQDINSQVAKLEELNLKADPSFASQLTQLKLCD